jgi:hypothetical protein
VKHVAALAGAKRCLTGQHPEALIDKCIEMLNAPAPPNGPPVDQADMQSNDTGPERLRSGPVFTLRDHAARRRRNRAIRYAVETSSMMIHATAGYLDRSGAPACGRRLSFSPAPSSGVERSLSARATPR